MSKAQRKRAVKKKSAPRSTTSTRKPQVSANEWKPRFLAELARRGNVREACDAVQIDRTTAYKARDNDAEFDAAWKLAREDAADTLEGEAWRRAVEGVEKPVFYLGEEIAQVREYSDGLLTLLLKANNPNKFADKSRSENLTLDLSTLSEAQLELLANGANLATVLAIAGAGGTGTAPASESDAKP